MQRCKLSEYHSATRGRRMDLPAETVARSRTGRDVEPVEHRTGDVQEERQERDPASGDYHGRVHGVRTGGFEYLTKGA